MDFDLFSFGVVDDTRLGLLLWRLGSGPECFEHHDDECDRHGHRGVVLGGSRLFDCVW